MKDPFDNAADSPIAPAQKCFHIAPSDGDSLQYVTKGIYVGEGGDIALVGLQSESPATFRNVPEGAILDVRARQVLATGTTASSLIGLA